MPRHKPASKSLTVAQSLDGLTRAINSMLQLKAQDDQPNPGTPPVPSKFGYVRRSPGKVPPPKAPAPKPEAPRIRMTTPVPPDNRFEGRVIHVEQRMSGLEVHISTLMGLARAMKHGVNAALAAIDQAFEETGWEKTAPGSVERRSLESIADALNTLDPENPVEGDDE